MRSHSAKALLLATVAVLTFAGCDVSADNEDGAELQPATNPADSARAVEDVDLPDSTRRHELPSEGVADTGTSGHPPD